MSAAFQSAVVKTDPNEMEMYIRKLRPLPFAFLALVLSGLSAAQTTVSGYPAKPVRIIAPFPPGGSVDTVARLVAARLTESFGQPFIIDNRSGASGNIGMEIAAKAAGDGYTLVVNTIPMVTNQFLYGKSTYTLERDFEPISLLTTTASALVVHPSMPVKTVRELIARANASGTPILYGSAGAGTNPHIAGELFNYLAKTNIQVIQFKGGGPSMVALLSGEINMGYPVLPSAIVHTRARRLRALGVTSLERSPEFPDIPAIAETLPGYEFSTWQGMLAPKNTPPEIINAISDRIKKTLSAPDQIKRFNGAGLDIVASTPDEFAVHIKKETAKWGKVIRERGMKVE